MHSSLVTQKAFARLCRVLGSGSGLEEWSEWFTGNSTRWLPDDAAQQALVPDDNATTATASNDPATTSAASAGAGAAGSATGAVEGQATSLTPRQVVVEVQMQRSGEQGGAQDVDGPTLFAIIGQFDIRNN